MYGRADGMPSFQLTVAVCICVVNLSVYESHWSLSIATTRAARRSQAPGGRAVLLLSYSSTTTDSTTHERHTTYMSLPDILPPH
jgi:hypothetical protein